MARFYFIDFGWYDGNMENILIYAVAVILAASILVACIEGQAGAIRRDKEPVTFWSLLSVNVGSFVALVTWAAAE